MIRATILGLALVASLATLADPAEARGRRGGGGPRRRRRWRLLRLLRVQGWPRLSSAGWKVRRPSQHHEDLRLATHEAVQEGELIMPRHPYGLLFMLLTMGVVGLQPSASSAQGATNPKNRKVVTHYADKATCRDNGVQFEVGNDKDGIELFYYEHDPQRLYLRSGFTYLLGANTSCTFRGLEDYRFP